MIIDDEKIRLPQDLLQINPHPSHPDSKTIIQARDQTICSVNASLTMPRDQVMVDTILALSVDAASKLSMSQASMLVLPKIFEVKRELGQLLFAKHGYEVDQATLNIESESGITSLGLLIEKIDEGQLKYQSEFEELCAKLAELGVERVEAGDIAFSPTANTTVSSEQKANDTMARDLKIAQMRFRYGGESVALIAKTTGFTVNDIITTYE